MAQQVQPVPNPNFSVKPLTTVAPSIVSRRQIKVPVNNPGTYGHIRSSLASEAVWDLADNECMVDLANIVLVADFTAKWSDKYLSPLLDAGTSGLMARLTIGTSQGLKIEEIQSYSQFASVVQSYSVDAQRKEMSLLDGSNFVTSFDKEKGSCSFFDSPGVYQGNCYIDPKYPQRLHIRFHHSSFMNNMRYLPLFLLRNGIRIAVEFENVYKAFNYSIAPSIQSMSKLKMIDIGATYGTGAVTDVRATNWFVSQGTQNLAGTARTVGRYVNAGVDTDITEDQEYTTAFAPYMGNKLHRMNSGYGHRAVHTIWIEQREAFRIFQRLCGDSVRPDAAVTADNSDYSYMRQHCVPIFIREKGYNVFYGLLTACPLDYGSGDLIPGETTTFDHNLSRFATSYANPTAQQNSTIAILTRAFDPATGYLVHTAANTSTYSAKYAFVPFNIEIPANSQPYFRSVETSTEYLKQFYYMNNRDVELLLDFENKFSVWNNTAQGDTFYAANSNVQSVYKLPIHPQIAAKLNPIVQTTGWDYELKNLELLLDLVKPSAQDFGKYMQAFQSPSGIPVAYKRILYQSKEISSTSAGQIQFTLPFSVRSMLGCLITLTDQMTGQDSTDWTKTTYPMLSSFMRRGLTRAELVIGGQVFPVYPMYCRRSAEDSENTLAQILEVERFFGVKSSMSFNPSFSEDKLRDTRNYLLCGPWDKTSVNFDDTTGTSLALNQYNASSSEETAAGEFGTKTVANTPAVFDASKFILAWSIAKDDVASFATGIDTSQSGTVVVNLYFDDRDPWTWTNRKIQAHFHILCDAVCTFQQAANLVRY